MSWADEVVDVFEQQAQQAGYVLVGAVGEAFAQALRDEAPVGDTARLSTRARYVGGGEPGRDLEGVVKIMSYAPYVSWGQPALSQTPSAVRARARYAARMGRAIAHPNPFIDRAWARALAAVPPPTP